MPLYEDDFHHWYKSASVYVSPAQERFVRADVPYQGMVSRSNGEFNVKLSFCWDEL